MSFGLLGGHHRCHSDGNLALLCISAIVCPLWLRTVSSEADRALFCSCRRHVLTAKQAITEIKRTNKQKRAGKSAKVKQNISGHPAHRCRIFILGCLLFLRHSVGGHQFVSSSRAVNARLKRPGCERTNKTYLSLLRRELTTSL